ncbi:MAG: hypothetical protein AAFV43_03500 [Planctomycetota bacterium]
MSDPAGAKPKPKAKLDIWAAGGSLERLVVFLAIRVYGLNLDLSDIRRGAYERQRIDRPDVSASDGLDDLLDMSKACFDSADERRSIASDKCKVLLTIASILFGAVGLSIRLDAVWMADVLAFVAALALVVALLVLLQFMRVGQESEPIVDALMCRQAVATRKRQLIQDYLKCTMDAHNRTDFLVDLYSAARFYVQVAVFATFMMLTLNVFWQSQQEKPSKVLLVGIDDGVPQLLSGPRGKTGPAGTDGKDAVVDYTELLLKLSESERFTDAVADSLRHSPRLEIAPIEQPAPGSE